MSTVRIDGSYGEGGGQVLRTSLAMAALTGRAVEIGNIRAGRPKPGLAAQHLTGCRAVAAITSGTLIGAEMGSVQLRFEPGPVQAGQFEFAVGTAGATTLVLQALLPALAFGPGETTLVLHGGTHVSWSPPFEYLRDVFLPALAEMGLQVEVELVRPGWYPEGGGTIHVRVAPVRELRPIIWPERGERRLIECVSGTSGLPDHVAERQLRSAVEALGRAGLQPRTRVWRAPARGKGSFCFVRAVFAPGLGGHSALGARGKPAEQVGAEAAEAFLAFLGSPAAVDYHLADQLLPYLALSRGESNLAVETVTSHLLTNAWVVQQFAERPVRVVGCQGQAGQVLVASSV
jgi:RNA 3'-terminal phosphate cyclase (ATP)